MGAPSIQSYHLMVQKRPHVMRREWPEARGRDLQVPASSSAGYKIAGKQKVAAIRPICDAQGSGFIPCPADYDPKFSLAMRAGLRFICLRIVVSWMLFGGLQAHPH
jgi:hypothetical protein